MTASLVLLWTAFVVSAAEPSEFNADPQSSELQRLAESFVPDESEFGCGPLLDPGNTNHVCVKGDDAADGLSWERAWRTLQPCPAERD